MWTYIINLFRTKTPTPIPHRRLLRASISQDEVHGFRWCEGR